MLYSNRRTNSWWGSPLCLALLLAGQMVTSQAGQLIPLAIEKLADEAPLVVHGRVLSQQCLFDEKERIYTRVQLEVEEVWKGDVKGDSIEVVYSGGTLGTRRTEVSYQVDYELGEEVVAFLVKNPRGEWTTLGLCQGKFHVWRTAGGADCPVTNPFHGRIPEGGIQRQRQHVGDAPRGLTLKALKGRVQGGRE